MLRHTDSFKSGLSSIRPLFFITDSDDLFDKPFRICYV